MTGTCASTLIAVTLCYQPVRLKLVAGYGNFPAKYPLQGVSRLQYVTSNRKICISITPNWLPGYHCSQPYSRNTEWDSDSSELIAHKGIFPEVPNAIGNGYVVQIIVRKRPAVDVSNTVCYDYACQLVSIKC